MSEQVHWWQVLAGSLIISCWAFVILSKWKFDMERSCRRRRRRMPREQIIKHLRKHQERSGGRVYWLR